MSLNDYVYYYKADADDATSVAAGHLPDWSGNHNDISLSGSPTLTTGKLGEGLLFDGATQYGQRASMVPWSFAAATISAWVKVNALPTSGSNRIAVIGLNDAWIGVNSDGTYRANVYDGSSNKGLNSGTAYTPGGFDLVTLTTDGTTAKLYINGSLKASTPAGSIFWEANIFYIGGSGSSLLFNGVIDDLRVYNRALSSTEVTALYNYTGSSAKPWVYAQAMRRLRGAA